MSNKAKVALVTGGNKGIGLDVVRGLSKLGYTTLLGARDEKLGNEAVKKLSEEGLKLVHFLKLDVANQASIQEAVKKVEADYGHLDALVNNAGILLERAKASIESLENIRKTYEVNVFGVIATSQAFIPLLKKSTAPRIVNVTSGLGSLTLHSDPNHFYYNIKPLSYNTSKSAANAVTVHFAYDLKDENFKVNSADPGYCATDLNAHSGPRTATQGSTVIIRLATLPSDGPNGKFFDENGEVPW